MAVLAVASAAMLGASPVFAIGASPLTFGATDAAAAAALGSPAPSVRVRIVSRALASAVWGGAASVIVATHGSHGTHGDETNGSGVRMTLLAIFLAIGAVVGALGSTGEAAREGRPPRPPFGESALVSVLDVLTAGWAFVLALAAHDGELRTRVVSVLGLATALALRALLIARIAARAARVAEDATLAAIGFVAWLAVAAVACTVAATPLTWSGLGAAMVLTLAAGLAESRRRRPIVVFLRGSLALAFAAMLGMATLLSS